MKFAQEIVSSYVYQVKPKNHKTLKDDGAEWFYDFHHDFSAASYDEAISTSRDQQAIEIKSRKNS